MFEIKNEKTKTIPTEKRASMRWKRKKVDWSSFEAEVEDKLDGTYRRRTISIVGLQISTKYRQMQVGPMSVRHSPEKRIPSSTLI